MSRDFWWSQWLAQRRAQVQDLQTTRHYRVQFQKTMYNSEWCVIPMCECVNLYEECKGVKVQCNARKEGWSVGGSSWVSTSDHGSKVWHKVVHHLRSPTLVEWGDVWCEVYMYVWEMREGEVAIKHSTQAINHTQNIHTWRTKLSTLSKKRRVWWVRTPTFYLERS